VYLLQEEAENADPKTLVESVNLGEAQYLLEHFITQSIAKVRQW